MSHAILVPVCEENVVDIVNLAEELMSLSRYKEPFDRSWALHMANTCCNLPNMFGRLAMLEDGSYCGFIIGSTSHVLYSPKLVSTQETIYVRDGTRFRASIGKQLMNALTHWAFTVKKAMILRTGETSGISPKGVDAFFKGLGFLPFGSLYIKENI